MKSSRTGHGIALLRVNLTSNVVRDCCLTLRFRSPLAPLKKGGKGGVKVPLLKGDLGGSRLGIKPRFIKRFSLKLTPIGSWSVPS